MRTQLRILRVVAGSLLEFAALVALLAGPLGAVRGFLAALAAVAAADLTYLGFIRPWQVHWGATGEEAMRPMPGDDIAGPSARCTTRAITIDAPAGQVWPWLTQPGYGRAGWYSYHWPGNGGQPDIRQTGIGQTGPEPGQLGSRDPVRMMPATGFEVAQVEDGHYFVGSLDPLHEGAGSDTMDYWMCAEGGALACFRQFCPGDRRTARMRTRNAKGGWSSSARATKGRRG